MPTLLHLDSSADLTGSVSRALTARFAAGWSARGADHVVVRRDLHTDPLPHLPSNVLHWAPRLRAADETVPADAEDRQRTLIDELLRRRRPADRRPDVQLVDPVHAQGVDRLHPRAGDHRAVRRHDPAAGRPARRRRLQPWRPVRPGHRRTPARDHEIPALQQVLGAALGMTVHVVTAELTLAGPDRGDGAAHRAGRPQPRRRRTRHRPAGRRLLTWPVARPTPAAILVHARSSSTTRHDFGASGAEQSGGAERSGQRDRLPRCGQRSGPGPGWQCGHHQVRRRPGSPGTSATTRIVVPQRRHGSPARPDTQCCSPGRVLPVVTCMAPGTVADCLSARAASRTVAGRSTSPTGVHGL